MAVAELATLLPPARAAPAGGPDLQRRLGAREVLNVDLAAPELVAEVSVDVARDVADRVAPRGLLRTVPDLTLADTPGWDTGDKPSAT